jgi:hypothetical protein
LDALKSRQKLQKDISTTTLSDLDYLTEFGIALDMQLKALPEESVGDLCLMIDQVTKSRQQYKDAPVEFVTMFGYGQKVAAVTAAKGAVNVLKAALMGGTTALAIGGVTDFAKQRSEYQRYLEICNSSVNDRSSLCSVDKLNTANHKAVTTILTTALFGL